MWRKACGFLIQNFQSNIGLHGVFTESVTRFARYRNANYWVHLIRISPQNFVHLFFFRLMMSTWNISYISLTFSPIRVPFTRLCRLFDEESIAKPCKYLRGMERFQKLTQCTMCIDKRKKRLTFSAVCVLCARESQSSSIQISWIIFSANISLWTDVDCDQ